MFKTRDYVEQGAGGPAAAAAALGVDQVVDHFPPDGMGRRFVAWRDAATDRLEAFERHFVHDLATEIGSARWYRGLATLAILSTAALALWPDFSRLEAAPTGFADHTIRDEFRSQMVMPLAMGGDSGRRMAANPTLVTRLAQVPDRASLRLVATLGSDDGLNRMLRRAGVGAWDAGRAAELIGAVMPIAELRPGTRFEIELGRRSSEGGPRALESLKFNARFDTALTVSRSNGGLVIGREEIPVDTTPLRIRGTVGQGLYRSARAAGAPPEAVQQYLQAVDRHLGLDEIAAGDGFDIVVEQKRSGAGQVQVGKLLYAGLDRGGKPMTQLLRWGGNGELVDAANPGGSTTFVEQRTGSLLMPVAGRITSTFGRRRHPILGYARMHAGIDFGAAHGSPISAVAGGVVTYAGRRGGHGNFVRLDHGGGLGTGYAHMSRIAVSPGTQVAAGQVIGYVGSTGLSTGPHLHYEVYQNGRAVNPLSVGFAEVRMQAAPVDPARMDELRKRLDAIRAIRPLGTGNTASSDKPAARARSRLAYRD